MTDLIGSPQMAHAKERFVCRTPVLWWSGLMYLALSIAFLIVMWAWDFLVIDEFFKRQDILAGVADLSATQKHVHVIVTATLDVAYPFAYGIFQAGMAYRFLGRWGRLIAPLSLICIPVDLAEGFAQIMILSGHLQFVETKILVTPIKLLLYVPGLCAALVALVIAASRRQKVRCREG